MANTELPGLLKQYNAQGHFAGHDHCMQHIERDDHFHALAGAGSDGWYKYSSISGAKWYMDSKNKGSVKGGFAELSIDSSGAKINYYDDKGSVLYTSKTYGPRSSSPTPSPSPAPTPAESWDCRTNKKAATGTDTNLQYTGDDLSTCQRACQETEGCLALYWHKTDSHCHVLTGSFSHDKWAGKLDSNNDYDSCFRGSSQEALV